jgi:hypothetical protein
MLVLILGQWRHSNRVQSGWVHRMAYSSAVWRLEAAVPNLGNLHEFAQVFTVGNGGIKCLNVILPLVIRGRAKSSIRQQVQAIENAFTEENSCKLPPKTARLQRKESLPTIDRRKRPELPQRAKHLSEGRRSLAIRPKGSLLELLKTSGRFVIKDVR